MKAIWEYFNGNKTTIAAVLMMAAIFGQEVVIDIWMYQPEWMFKMLKSLNWIGMSLGGVGILHKGTKAIKESKNTAP